MARILIVDDNPDICDLCSQLVEGVGHEALTAENGLDGIDVAVHERPDLIFMDLMMPRLNGFEATKAIKGRPELANIPIVALTAKSSLEDHNKAFKVGMIDYLTKPFRAQSIYETLRTYIGVAGSEVTSNRESLTTFAVVAHYRECSREKHCNFCPDILAQAKAITLVPQETLEEEGIATSLERHMAWNFIRNSIIQPEQGSCGRMFQSYKQLAIFLQDYFEGCTEAAKFPCHAEFESLKLRKMPADTSFDELPFEQLRTTVTTSSNA